MSRFEKYMIESVKVNGVTFSEKEVMDFLKFWDKIEKNCQPYLKDIKVRSNVLKKMLLRGTKRSSKFFERAPREDRYPKDMPEPWHEAFDDWFKDNFGWRARSSGLFCTGSKNTAGSYGDIYMVFPAGRYDYVWSPDITDLYSAISDDAGFNYIKPSKQLLRMWEKEYEEEYEEGMGSGSWWYDNEDWGLYNADRDTAIEEILDRITEDLRQEESELEGVLENDDEDEIEEYGSVKEINIRIKEIRREIKDYEKDITSKIEWMPKQDFDSFMEYKTDNIFEYFDYFDYDMYYEAVDSICRGSYTNTGLIRALDISGNEIMVKCNKYYAINYSFFELVNNALWGEAPDPRQMAFDFGKK